MSLTGLKPTSQVAVTTAVLIWVTAWWRHRNTTLTAKMMKSARTSTPQMTRRTTSVVLSAVEMTAVMSVTRG